MPRPFARPMSDQELATRPHGIPAGQLVPGGTPPDVLERLQEHLGASRHTLDELARVLKHNRGARVIETATVTIPATGVYEQGHITRPYASIAVLYPTAPVITDPAFITINGEATTPAALAQICKTANLTPGDWLVTVTVSLGGTLAAGTDMNNLKLSVVGIPPAIFLPNGIGPDPQTFGPYPVTVPAGAGNAVQLNTTILATTGAIYAGTIVAVPAPVSSGQLVVSTAAAQGSAPGGGQGQAIVPAGTFAAWNMAGSALSIYGPPGTSVTYTLFADGVPPIVTAA